MSRRFFTPSIVLSVLVTTIAANSAWCIDLNPDFEQDCYNFQDSGRTFPSPINVIHEAVYLGLNVRQTAFFQDCIRRSGYRACNGDLSPDVEDGVRVSLSSNHLVVGCHTLRSGVLGEAGIGTQLFFSGSENVRLSHELLLDALPTSGVKKRSIASTLWHEAAHNHGYRHEFNTPFCRDTPDGPGRPSMNEIIGQCMNDAANHVIATQFQKRILDVPSFRPSEEELDSLLNSLTSTGSLDVERSASSAVERWLEGPDFRIRASDGTYFMDWFATCNGLCFAGLVPGGSSPQKTQWHIVPTQAYSPLPTSGRPGNSVRIVNVDSGRCLLTPSQLTGIMSYGLGYCRGTRDEEWEIGPMSVNPNELDRGRYKLYPRGDHTKCFAPDLNSHRATTSNCLPSTTDFTFEYVTNRSQAFTIRTADSARCLDVPDGSNSATTAVQLFPCHGGPNQLWRLREQSGLRVVHTNPRDGEYFVQNDQTGLCLKVDGSQVKQAACGKECSPGDLRCLSQTSTATPLSIRGYGTVFIGGYGYLTGYGNTFQIKNIDADYCLSSFYTGSALSYRSCASIQSDQLSSLRWRFFRAR